MNQDPWKPINTIPFDQLVLVFSGGRKEIEIRYRPRHDRKTLYPGGSDIGWYTHWMPLPEPPSNV